MQLEALLAQLPDALVALPLEAAIEIMRPLPLRRLEGVPSFVAGAAVVRGKVTPVVDLAALITGTTDPTPGRWITVSTAAGQAALQARDVLGIHTLDFDALETAPLLTSAQRECVDTLTTTDGALAAILDVAHVISEPIWAALHTEHRFE